MRKQLKNVIAKLEDSACARGHYRVADFFYGCYRFVNRIGRFKAFGWRMVTLR
jgi:hypothetical protein